MKTILCLMLLPLLMCCEEKDFPTNITGKWEVLSNRDDTLYFNIRHTLTSNIEGSISSRYFDAIRLDPLSIVIGDSVFLYLRFPFDHEMLFRFRSKINRNVMIFECHWSAGIIPWKPHSISIARKIK